MSLWSRLRLLVQARANRALDDPEEPGEALDLAYEKQLEAMQRVRRGIADVVTAQKQLELQQRQMEANRARLEAAAREALEQHRDDLAASALTQSELVETQLAALRQQMEALAAQRENLETAGQRLQSRLTAMRAQRVTLKAQYSAAQAAVLAGETMAGISEDMEEVQLMLERARDKMLRTQARAEAVNELMETGVMSRLGPGGGVEAIEAQVHAVTVEQSVDQRLHAMRQELGLEAPAAAARIEPAPAAKTPRRRGSDGRTSRPRRRDAL